MSLFWISKRQAIAEGFTHEGTHFGLPVWCEYDDATGDMGVVAAKVPALELVLSLGAAFTQLCNSMREPGDEFMFAFRIKRIDP